MIARYKSDLLALGALAGIVVVLLGTPVALGRTWLALPHGGAFADSPIGRTAHLGRRPARSQDRWRVADRIPPWPRMRTDASQLESLAPLQIKASAELIFNALAVNRVSYTTPNAWPGISESDQYPSWSDYAARRVFYNLLAVNVLLDNRNGWLSKSSLPDLTPVWSNDAYILYRDKRARARAYLIDVSEPRTPVRSDRARVSRIEVIGDLVELARQAPAGGEVDVRKITPGSMRIDVRAVKPALLVVADAYYPGWDVMVDGQARPIARVGGALRGVFVNPGDQHVEFIYRPNHLRSLIAMSLFTGVAALLLVLGASRFVAAWGARRRVAA